MIKSILSTVLKGLVVGASMLVPGVSGGTTCIILGIYDKLIHAVSSFFSDIKHNFALLALFCLGGGIGMILFSRAMLWAVETWKLPMMCFFLGAILGSLPMLYRQAKVDRFKPVYILFAILGFAIVLALQFIPKPESGLAIGGIGQVALLFASGLVIAVALVLPGISTSQMLIVLGMYETTLQAIKTLNLPYLVPLGLGGLLGIVLVTGLIEKALTKYPRVSYFFIIGFVVGSLKFLVDPIIAESSGLPSALELGVCVVTLAGGYAAIRAVSKYSKE
ncbi:MAG TPA: DUF368 domain-containing protein [Treponemataceae bacterium]|nr:DUF368 domain-containing protein [Treponemataceae bacterium]